jgi:hypothetical protein
MDRSPLGCIPAELRTQIYEYALTFDQLSCKARHSDKSEPSLYTQLALTCVCRQIWKETRQMPFALNSPVAGSMLRLCLDPGPCLRVSTILEGLRGEVEESINSVPSSLISSRTTFSVEVPCWHKHQFKSNFSSTSIGYRWTHIKLSFGRLIHDTEQEKFVLDFTPRRKCDTGRLWCEVDNFDPVLTGQASPLSLEVVLDTDCPWGHRVARFDRAQITTSIHEHETHDRFLCNVAKRGKILMAQLEQLEAASDSVIPELLA